MLQSLDVSIRGIAPLIMHNGQTSDPLNPFSKQMKAISGKKKKTDEDFAELARVEWHAGLYVNKDGQLIIPSFCLEAAILAGAKQCRLGSQFKAAVFVNDDALLDIGTKKKAIDLWAEEQYRDVRGVRIQRNRIMRTRPIFHQWACTFEIHFDDEQVNQTDVERAIVDAGLKCGLCDYRPKFGRFEVVK